MCTHGIPHGRTTQEPRTCQEAHIGVDGEKDQPHRGRKQTERCIESQIGGQGATGLAGRLLAKTKGRHPPPIFVMDCLHSCKSMVETTCTYSDRCAKTRDPLCSQNCTLAIVQQPAMLHSRCAEEDINRDIFRFILLHLAWARLSGTLASFLRRRSRFPWLPIPLEGRGSTSFLRHLLAP